jgi:hypothetical protein
VLKYILELLLGNRGSAGATKRSVESRLSKLMPVELTISGHESIIDFDSSGKITVVRCDGIVSDDILRLQRFLSALITQPAAYGLLNKRFGADVNHHRRSHALKSAFDAWESMNGEVDSDGNLKKSMTCIAYRESRSNDWFRCTQPTKSTSGLCRFHHHAKARTIFNFDMLSKSDRIWRSVERD